MAQSNWYFEDSLMMGLFTKVYVMLTENYTGAITTPSPGKRSCMEMSL